MIKNIKLPVTFSREYSVSVSYHFFEIDKMTCSRNLARKGGISLLGKKMSQYFEYTSFQISLNFWYLLQAVSGKTKSLD